MTGVLTAAMVLSVFFSQTVSASDAGFNQHPGKSYEIRLSDGGEAFDNVSEGNGNYEGDFFRVGPVWNRDGSGMGASLEICDEAEVANLWAYAHNGANFADNHSAPLAAMTILQLEGQTVGSNFDFAADGVLENAAVKISHAGAGSLDTSSFANSHALQLTFSADSRSGDTVSASRSVTLFCDDEKIALSLEGVDDPDIFVWASETEYANYGERHQRAVDAFGSPYELTDPGALFAAGSKFGYDGNLPASRYYAAYVKAQVKIVKETCEDRGDCPPPPPEPKCPPGGKCEEPDAIPDTAGESASAAEIFFLPAMAAVAAFSLHRAVSRGNRSAGG